MKILDQAAARAAVRALKPRQHGAYDLSKYTLFALAECDEREALLHLYKEAHQRALAARAEEQCRRRGQGVTPLQRGGSGAPKLWMRNPRDIGIDVPDLLRLGDLFIVRTNCKLNRHHAEPVREAFPAALRRVQRRRLP